MSMTDKLLSLFNLQKKDEKVIVHTPGQHFAITSAVMRHGKKIKSLQEEFESLAYELQNTEINTDLPRADREKASDRIITRMTLLKNELEIREELLNGLNPKVDR